MAPTAASCRAAPRAAARPAGSCSTTGTLWSTSLRPTPAITTAWKTSGAKPRPAPSADPVRREESRERQSPPPRMRWTYLCCAPVVEHGRYDLAFVIGDNIYRVQCKWGSLDQDGAVIPGQPEEFLVYSQRVRAQAIQATRDRP